MLKVIVILGGLGVEGISTIALSYLEAMDNANLSISLCVAGPSDKTVMQRAKKIGNPIIMLPFRKKNPAAYYKDLFILLKKEKPDIVHIHGNSATMALDLLVAELAGVPVRLPHCHNTKCDSEKVNNLLRPLLYMTMTEGLACGEAAGKWLYKGKNYKVIKNGRKIEDFLFDKEKRNKYRLILNLKDDIVAIGHVGSFTEQKNQIFLIDMMNNLKGHKFKLFLFGDGVLRKQCENLVKDRDLENQIVFLGNVPNIGDYLNAMDIMALPSKFEGLPLVAIEWQINGLPSIISDQVTKKCKIMSNVVFESILPEKASDWAEIINSGLIKRSNMESTEICRLISDVGYDINQNAKVLSREYEMLNEKFNKI